jgi:hypothetical protein
MKTEIAFRWMTSSILAMAEFSTVFFLHAILSKYELESASASKSNVKKLM